MPADSYSAILGWLDQGTGNNNNTWGDNCDTSIFPILEKAITGYLAHAVTGGTLDLSTTTPPVGATSALEYIRKFTGTLGSNQVVQVPNVYKTWLVWNTCTLAGFTLKFKTSAGSASAAIPVGVAIVFCDGNNVCTVGPSTFTTQFLAPDGTAALPGLSWANQTDTGFRHSGYASGTLTADPITTVNASPTVTIAHTAHGLVVGDPFVLAGAATVGGLDHNGKRTVATTPTADTYTYTAASNATSSTTGGGAVVTYKYLKSTANTGAGMSVDALGADIFHWSPFGFRNAAELWQVGAARFEGAVTMTALLSLSSNTSHMQSPVGTTAQRPGLPTAGDRRFNSTTGAEEFYNGSNWISLGTITAALSGFVMINGTIVTSVAANALTIAIKGVDGNDPSTSNPVFIAVRNATVATGNYTLMTITAALSLVLSSGSTLGFTSATPGRLWLVVFNDTSNVARLGVINCLSSLDIFPLEASGVASSTAEGGVGGADSAHTIYSGTAVASKAYGVLGYMTWETGLTTAGAWDAVPTRIQLFGYGSKLPGDIMQSVVSQDGAVANGATTIPQDDTIPQSSEGTQYMSRAIVPTSAANLLRVSHQGMYAIQSGADALTVALFQDAVANALWAAGDRMPTANFPAVTAFEYWKQAGTQSGVTFKIRAGAVTNATTFNGQNSLRLYGGVSVSRLAITEFVA